MTDQPLSSVQIQQIQQAAADQLRHTIAAMELRKWAVDIAIKNPVIDEKGGQIGIITVAGAIYNFVIQPSDDVQVTILDARKL